LSSVLGGEPLVETEDRSGAFPPVDDGQIEAPASHGERRRTGLGEVLYRQGEARYDFDVILVGAVAIVEARADRRPRAVRVHRCRAAHRLARRGRRVRRGRLHPHGLRRPRFRE